MKSDYKERFSAIEIGFILLCFCICFAGALLIPTAQCPDEAGRLLLTEYIVKNDMLPTGNELETMIPGWGFSYALRPYLCSIIGALALQVAALFTDSTRMLLAAARMSSVFSVTTVCFFCLRLGHRLFEKKSSTILFATFVCFLPQVMFLGMYQNCDSLSLCAVSIMLYYWVEGYDRKWPIGSCVGMAVGITLGLLSYYSVYGWILMCAIFCILAVLTDPEIHSKGSLVFRRAALITGICLLLAGWFFIRNAALHGGDFLGLISEVNARAKLQEQGYTLYDYVCFRDQGMTVADFLRFGDYTWIRMTAMSFVGVFGYMNILLPEHRYGIYYSLFSIGIIMFAFVLFRERPDRRNRLLVTMMVLSSGITLFLHFWQCYSRDFQTQGRYVITLSLLLGYMVAFGFDNIELVVLKTKLGKNTMLQPAIALTVIWLLMFSRTAIETMSKMFW